MVNGTDRQTDRQTSRQTGRLTTRTVWDVLLVTNFCCRVTAFRPFDLVAGKLNRHIELGWFDGWRVAVCSGALTERGRWMCRYCD